MIERNDIDNGIEKSTWKTHRYFVDFESRIHVEISRSNRCHNVHVDSPSKIAEISTNFPRGISTSNQWRIDEDVPIGLLLSINFAANCEVVIRRGFALKPSERVSAPLKNCTRSF